MDLTLLLIYGNLKQAALLSNALMRIMPEINLFFVRSMESTLRCPIPELIILDLDQPSPFPILPLLKAHEGYRLIPVIALTSSLDLHEINRAYELGADLCVFKGRGEMSLEVARGIGTYLRALKDQRQVA
jgi:CheY-like chemotaxis protein